MWSKIREPLLFFAGLYGFMHEVLSKTPAERPVLITACVSLMIGGLVSEADKRRAK